MSATNQTAGPSTDHFTAIFNVASTEYQTVTGNRLDAHPLAAQLNACHSPEDISNLLRTQAHAFRKFRRGDEKLMTWLDPIVRILFVSSATLGEGIALPFSPAKTIFTGIGVLLEAVRDVAASHDKILHLFERIHFFLQRLNIHSRITLTIELAELLGKIMGQLLWVLALSTKAMTERRMKKFLKKLAGRRDVEDALERLDTLTKEEISMTVARNLRITCDIDHNVKATKDATDEAKRNQLQEKIRAWLSPPDPSINHNTACKAQHGGTATWFTQGSTFREWKKNGSLLWVRGNRAGKSILCSAIIEDIQSMREALFAYYYFDYKDTSKRNVHGLLVSILFQLSDDSEHCRDVLYQLHKKCRDGSQQPSDAALAKCLKTMLELSEQLPILVVMDALDECPNTTGTPSAREEVLDFIEHLVGSRHSNLFICITSRPEHDIHALLNPLTSPSCRISLHEELGQRDDINNYIRSFVYADRAMRRWRKDDKEFVITTLSERAQGMFRWVFCQLDTLRRCIPSSIRKVLDELPTTLDDTYERALQGIPKEKRQYAHHLFQCLVVAIRPLRVEELAEIFTIKFDADSVPSLMEGWRPEHPEEAVLSTCSTLIAVIEDEGSKIVQFSHFSVKEFLTSDRLCISDIENIRIYHIPVDAAHAILAQACLAVLLQLDEKVDKNRLATFPLALYAARYWVDHALFEDVVSRIQNAIECLFNPRNPFLSAWVWIHNVDHSGRFLRSIDTLIERPPQPLATALYYAALCGFSGLINYLVSTHAEDVNSRCGRRGSPLHAASYEGHFDVTRSLLDHGVDVNMKNARGDTPLGSAYAGGHLEVMRLLLSYGADADLSYLGQPALNDASNNGRVDVVHLLLQHSVDVNGTGYGINWTALHWASCYGHPKVVKLLLEYGAEINALSKAHNTPLRLASGDGQLEVVQILLEHGADVHIRGERNQTPFQAATSNNHTEVAQLLLEHGAEKE